MNFSRYILIFCLLTLSIFLSFCTFIKSPQYIEKGLNDLKFHSPKSSQKKFGDLAWTQVISSSPPGGKAYFASIDKKQKLTLIFHPGGSKNSFSELSVEYTKESENLTPLKQNTFISSKGIQLGLSLNQLVHKLGKPTKKVSHSNKTVLSYQLLDQGHPILKKHNMPAYYGEYTFKDKILIKFSFGFTSP